MSNTQNAPFDFNLQRVASIAASKLAALDVSRIIPIEVVDPTEDHGLIRVDRTDLAVTGSGFETVRGEFDEGYAIEVADGSDVSYRCSEVRLPSHAVPRKRNQRRQVRPGLLDKAAAAQAKMLAETIYKMGVGVYTAANFPSRTAAFSTFEPGALQINDVNCNVIYALKGIRDAAMDGAGQHRPNLCIIGELAARAIGKNANVLSKLPLTVASHGLPKSDVIALLEQHLEMRVEVSSAEIAGTWLWDSDNIAMVYNGNRLPAPQMPNLSNSVVPAYTFPGQVREANKDAEGYLDNELTSAVMIMSRFPDIEDVIGGGDPVTWGITTKTEDRQYLVNACAFVSRKVLDPLSGYIASNSMA